MSDVPPKDFLWEILLRLPAESLLRFRRVCKAWRGMIDDPSFIKAHTQNQLFTHTLLVRSERGLSLFSFSVDSLNAINGSQMIQATPIRANFLPDLFQTPSCNGLIFLSNLVIYHTQVYMNSFGFVWNPLTGDCHVLPKPNGWAPTKDVSGYGFGYGCEDDYKVVIVNQFLSPEKKLKVNQTQIYSLKSGSWSSIEDSPAWLPHIKPGAFLNGIFYWVSKSLDKIISFHLNTKTYSQTSIPPLENRSSISLEALDGFLILSFLTDDSHFEGWVMKDDGWDKLFSVEFSEQSYQLNLVCYLKDKRQILVQYDKDFLLIDVDKETGKMLSIHGFPSILSSRICPGSLVRFHSSGSSSTPTTKKESKSSEKFMFCLRDDQEKCRLDFCWNCHSKSVLRRIREGGNSAA